MEKRKCKLCPRTFNGGRALGGHMKSHLSHPNSEGQQLVDHELSESSAKSSFLSSSSEEDELETSSLLGDGLRENPKRSVKLQHPELSASMDRESETESIRYQSKRARKVATPPESEQLSSVSDASAEEDLAMCLMMLSRNQANWRINDQTSQKVKVKVNNSKKKTASGVLKCDKCMERYRSIRALRAHERVCSFHVNEEEVRVFECPYCFKLFGSGQALGGHKRAHLAAAANNNNNNNNNNGENCSKKVRKFDLNLPASPGGNKDEDDQFSVILEA